MLAMTTWRRESLSQTVEGVPQTFSSWNNCMSKAYCKWPAIIGIIIGALLAISLLWCLARCLCCGTSCCLSCCDCCPSRSRRNNSSNYADNNNNNNNNQPSIFHPAPYQGYQPAPPPPSYEPPQFARFDTSKKAKVNEDALPAMPSWDTASERKVPVEQLHSKDEAVELGRLDPVSAQQQAPMLAAYSGTGASREGYAEMDSTATPYRQQGGYRGGDLGSSYGRQESGGAYGFGGAGWQGYGRQGQVAGGGYGGRSGYEAYTPSESTEFEPPSVGHGGEARVYSPVSSTGGRQYGGGQASSGAPVGRKAVADSWRDV